MEYINIKTAVNMKDTTLMTKSMGTAPTTGPTAVNTKVNGRMASSMGKANIR